MTSSTIWNRRQTMASCCHHDVSAMSGAAANANASLLRLRPMITTRTATTRKALCNNRRQFAVTAATVVMLLLLLLISIGNALLSTTRCNNTLPGFEARIWKDDGAQERRDLHFAGVMTEDSLETNQNPTHGEMIILVLSAASNQKRRDAIRETWGIKQKKNPQQHFQYSYTVWFVVGMSSSSSVIRNSSSNNNNNNKNHQNLRFGVPLLVQAESNLHGDLLAVPVDDTYENLPRKLHEAIQWVIRQNDDTIQWIVKADDDMFLRPNALYQHFLRTLNPHIPIVAGCILQDEPVRNYGKWHERTFQGPIYPTFPQGSCGYVISRPVATYIAKQALGGSVTYYHGEDTSLGIWLSSWRDETKRDSSHHKNANETDEDDGTIQWIHASTHFVNNGICDDTNNMNAFIIGHKITPEHMMQCFLKYHSSDSISTDELERITYIRVGSTTVSPGDEQPPNKNEKKGSEEYQRAIARYHQNEHVMARKRQDEQRRAERERRRREWLDQAT